MSEYLPQLTKAHFWGIKTPMDTQTSHPEPASQQETPNLTVRRPSRRAIDMEDAKFIADRVAEGMTELDAVNLLDKFSYNVWMHWKARPRNASKASHLFARTRAARQRNLIESISIVGDINRVRPPGVRHDWRAAQMLASLNDQRFSNQKANETTVNQTAVIVQAGGDQAVRTLLDRIFTKALPGPSK